MKILHGKGDLIVQFSVKPMRTGLITDVNHERV